MMAPLLAVNDLEVRFRTEDGETTPVRGVTLSVSAGETVALVGESGSGKSVTSLAVMGLLPRPAGRVSGGEILFRRRSGDTVDLATLPASEVRRLRGSEMAMIFQEPMTSLNPVLSIGEQIAESVRQHMGLGRAGALKRAVEMLDLVEIPDARRRVHEYPHQMSGGMRQRVMIALAMSCNPSLLIADEPTTALDVTIQAQILALIDRLRREIGMGVLFITHNLGVVAEVADRVTVMYAGQVVESSPVGNAFPCPAPSLHERASQLPAGPCATRRRRSPHGAIHSRQRRTGERRLRVCAALRLRHRHLPPRRHSAGSRPRNGASRCLRWREVLP